MRKFLKWVATTLGIVLLLVVVAYGMAWHRSESALSRTYVVKDPPLTILRDAPSMAQGAHLFATRGCAECHGGDGAGKLVFDAGPVLKLVGPNITRGGRIGEMSPDQIAAAIRHGVKPDGHPMVFMPTPDFAQMSDADTAALVAFLQSLPPSANNPGELEIRPLGRLMYVFGNFPLIPAELVNHTPRERSAPPVAATAAYGRYVAEGCVGCHGRNFAGQHVPGTPPSFPDSQNLTPAALGSWKQADFRRALREGKRPDGSDINTFMPWKSFAKMSDTELDALWAYLQMLPPVQSKKK
jgi:mono/diheme cytochrome c family protein